MVSLTSKEQGKVRILHAAIEGILTNEQAAKQLNLSIRQVQRAKKALRSSGIESVVHGLKGKPGNHRYSFEQKTQVIEVIQNKYADFKPKFATEKLQETQGIPMTSQTIRVWMTEAKIWKPRKQKQAQYFSWRPRKQYYGELQQFDGSYHYWFEDRYIDAEENPLEVCLLAAIDDATGQITRAVFAEHEGVVPVFTFWKKYLEDHGKPGSIYLDRFSTYKINHKSAVDNSELLTQFERAMKTLDIVVIPANSPQAKGRVERLFQTLQDRLVKELRLAHISNPTDGNSFLKDVFIPQFNKQFSVVPTKQGNVHRRLTNEEQKNLSHTFSIHDTRRVNNDFTIQFKNKFYQLTEIQPTTVRPQEKVLVEIWLDETVHFLLRNQDLNTLVLPEKPKKQRMRQPVILTTHTLNWKPPSNHPWRKGYKSRG